MKQADRFLRLINCGQGSLLMDKKFTHLGLACCLAASSSFAAKATIVVPEAHFAVYSQAVKNEKIGNFKQAVTQYSSALEVEKRDVETLTKLGLMYLHSDTTDSHLRQQSFAKAESYLSKAEQLRPNDAMICILHAQALEGQAKHEEAIKKYKKAITLEPENSLIRLSLGLLYYEIKDYKHSIENLSQVVMNYPENLKARSYLGASLQATDNYMAAIEQYNYVLNYEAEHFGVTKNLGDSWLALDQLEKAKESYQKAKTLDPQVPHIYADLAYIASKETEFDKAVDYYKQALSLEDNEDWKRSLAYALWANDSLDEAVTQFEKIEEFNVAAYLYQVLGKKDQAVASYKKALESDPKDIKSMFNLARLYNNDAKYDLAKEQYLKVLEYKPNDIETMFLLAVLEHETGSYEQAVKYYKEILTKKNLADYKDTEIENKINFNIALAYKAQNNYEEAEKSFEKVLAGKSSFAESQNIYKELSFVKIALNKHSEAEKIVSEWLREDPTNVEARNLYADYLIHKSKERQAIEQLRLASVLDKSTETRLKLANLLHSQNNLYEALAEYQKVLQSEPENLNAILGAANNFKALGLKKEALDLYTKAVEKYPEDLLSNYNLALMLHDSDENETALEHYQKVAQLNPNFVENYYVMGLCYWDLGQKEKAVQIWEKFISGSSDEGLKAEIIKKIDDYQVEQQAKSNQEKKQDLLKEDLLDQAKINTHDFFTAGITIS